MHHRLIAIFAILFIAVGGGGCASKSRSKRYEEVLMPVQTGSTLQRRVFVESTGEQKKKRKEKKKAPSTAKPETETAETPPTPEEEAPPPERYR
jgi:hypothetical protein